VLAVLGIGLLHVLGCVTQEDLNARYGLEETRSILMVPYPEYLDTNVDLNKGPRRAKFWFRSRQVPMVLEEIAKSELENRPEEARPAYALVFFFEDDVSFKTLLLDQYLNVWPGFQFLGETYSGPYCKCTRLLKWTLLERIFRNRRAQSYLVDLLEQTKPKTR